MSTSSSCPTPPSPASSAAHLLSALSCVKQNAGRPQAAGFAERAFHKLATYETIRNELRRSCVFRDFLQTYSPRTLKHHQLLGRNRVWITASGGWCSRGSTRPQWCAGRMKLWTCGTGHGSKQRPTCCTWRRVAATNRCPSMPCSMTWTGRRRRPGPWSERRQGASTGNTWADLTRMGVEQQCLTFVMWRHCLTETRLEYSENIAKDSMN